MKFFNKYKSYVRRSVGSEIENRVLTKVSGSRPSKPFIFQSVALLERYHWLIGCIHIMACRPPANKTYLTIGQDLFSISEYVNSQYNYSLHHQSNLTIDNITANYGDNGLSSISNFVPSGKCAYLRRDICNNISYILYTYIINF